MRTNLRLAGALLISTVITTPVFAQARGDNQDSSDTDRAAADAGEGDTIIVTALKGAQNLQERFAVMAPTLIDTTQAQKIGSSMWQFQILAKGDQFSAWNMKSLNGSLQMEKNLAKIGSHYQLYQVSPNEYEMMMVQENQGVRQYLSIRYDAIASR